MRNSLAGRGILALLGCSMCALESAAQGSPPPTGGAGNGPPPCGDIYIPCWEEDPGSRGGEGSPCICGTGAWVQEDMRTILDPPTPFTLPTHEHSGSIHIDTCRHGSATAFTAVATVDCEAEVDWFAEASRSLTQAASFDSGWRMVWKGPGPRCPRKIMLQATGNASVEVTATCSANSGCTASSSGSVAGSCSSHGDASAEINSGELKCSANYESGSQAWHLGGSIGPSVPLVTPSVSGDLNSEANWLAKGQGSCTGTCTLAVRPDRAFCAFTNRSIRATMGGSVAVSGSATVANDGSAAFRAEACLTLRIS